MTIALDAMGGDHGPAVVVTAALRSLIDNPQLHLILVGDEPELKRLIATAGHALNSRLVLQHATEVVTMEDKPSIALRRKKDSSMRVAINLVKEGRAQACVSNGNTGALMGIARFVLKTLPGIDRPAFISKMPVATAATRMIDLGANIDSSPEQLYQFAVMGSAMVAAVEKKPRPTVGLLNIGAEELKGNDVIKQTAELFKASDVLNYIGFVEGDQIFTGEIDLVVCDGFLGNIALKTTEGFARLMGTYIKRSFGGKQFTKLVAKSALTELVNLVDPSNYNGASLLGLQGIVIKSHGSAKVPAFANAIKQAIIEVEQNVPKLIASQLEEILV